MKTILLAWDGSDDGFHPRDYAAAIRRTAEGRDAPERWSVGSRTRDLDPGDRVYLLRQRSDRGVVASGYLVDGKISRMRHWRAPSREANYSRVRFERVVDGPDRLPSERLIATIPGFDWNSVRSSGREVPEPAATELARGWREHLVSLGFDAGLPVDPIDEPIPPRAAGFLKDALLRKAIETHAVATATAHYGRLKYKVEDVGAKRSYDLLLTRKGEVRHVEVKGSTVRAAAVELTRNEVVHSREAVVCDLFVVHNIGYVRKSAGGGYRTFGGISQLFEDWRANDRDLAVTRYRYALPPGGVMLP